MNSCESQHIISFVRILRSILSPCVFLYKNEFIFSKSLQKQLYFFKLKGSLLNTDVAQKLLYTT